MKQIYKAGDLVLLKKTTEEVEIRIPELAIKQERGKVVRDDRIVQIADIRDKNGCIVDVESNSIRYPSNDMFLSKVGLDEITPIKINSNSDLGIILTKRLKAPQPVRPCDDIPLMSETGENYYYNENTIVHEEKNIKEIVQEYNCTYIHELQSILREIFKSNHYEYILETKNLQPVIILTN